MTDGWALSERVAREVLGYTTARGNVNYVWLPEDKVQCPAYHSDIAAAWTLVEWMKSKGWSVRVDDYAGKDPTCSLCTARRCKGYGSAMREFGDTAPEAICRCALQVAEWEQRQKESEA